MNVTSEILKLDVVNLTFEELRQEYELSQWALAHALHKLGDCMTVTRADAEAFNRRASGYGTTMTSGSNPPLSQ